MRDEYDFSQARRGPVIDAAGKTRITIYLDADVLAAFRDRAGREGKGYQTLINQTLRATIAPEAAPVTVEILRRVLREELRGAA